MDSLGNPVPVLEDPGRTRFHVMDPVERKKRLREQGEDTSPLLARAVASVDLSEEGSLLEALRRELEGIDDPRERRKTLAAWKESLVRRGLKNEAEARALAERVLHDLESPDTPAPTPLFKW